MERLGPDPRGFAHLLEREIEQQRALAAIARALSGEGSALAYVSRAGVGKTSLLKAAAVLAAARGARVLSARAVDLEYDLGFGVARQLFTPVLIDATADERAELLSGPAALAEPALGIGAPASMGDPTSAALHGLHWLCANLVEQAPLVLAIDDLHWADEASVRFLAYLTRRLDGLPLLVLLASRPGEQGFERAVVDELLGDPAVERLQVAPLSDAATASLVRRRLGQESSDSLCGACHLVTGGNPFLLGELLESLEHAGIDPATAGFATVERVGPESIARSVLIRLRRLSPDALQLARAAAIFREGAPFRHVAAVARLAEDAAALAADQLEDVAIFAPASRLEFLHPVMRTAVYEDLPGAERQQLHRRAVELLRSDNAPPEAVATHLLAIEPGGDPRALPDLLAAAAGALAAGAPESARSYLDRGLQEPAPEELQAAALHLRGLVHFLSGDPRAVGDLRAAADRVPGGVPRALILRDLARVLGFAFLNRDAVALLDEAMAECGPDAIELRDQCHVDLTWNCFMHDDLSPRYVEEMNALEVPREPATVPQMDLSAIKGHWLAWQCIDAEEAIAYVRRALVPQVYDADGFDGLPAVATGATALYLADRPEEGLAAAEAMIEVQRNRGARRTLSVLHLVAGTARMYAGDLADAESDFRLAREYVDSEISVEIGSAVATACLAVVTLERAGPEAALEVLEELCPMPTLAGRGFHAARGRIHLAAGRPEAALEDLEAAQRSARAGGLLHPLYMFSWGGEVALAAAAVGERGRALRRAEEDLRVARRFGATGTLGGALRVAGLVRGGPEGLALLAEAAETLSRSSARLLEAQTLADYGAALRRDGQRVAAREPLRRAIDLARRCGATRLFEYATDELRATGGRRRADYVTGVEALTPSERRVAMLAAQGLSNREIAQRLFLTVKTIEMHMTGAFSKLGVSSRRHLVDALEVDSN